VKRDAWVLGGIALLVIAAVVWALVRPGAAYAEVYLDNALVERIALDRDADYRYEVDGGAIVLRVKAGGVTLTHADCPNGACRRMVIRRAGDMIVCAPNGFVCVAAGGQVDAVSGMAP